MKTWEPPSKYDIIFIMGNALQYSTQKLKINESL